MSRSEEALAPARADLPSGTVTFVFTDIEGSTKLAHGLGTERWGEVLAQHASAIRAAYRAHRGVEVRTEGDSFFLAFEAARHAVGFAAEAQRALAATRWKHDAPVRVRMGMHTGEGARPGTVADASDYVGYEVHLAARVAAAPRGGQVVISAATAQLTGDQLPPGVALRDLGEHQLKDITQPIRLYQLVVDGLPSDFPALRTLSAVANNLPVQLTSFVGRQSELETARGLLERTRLVTLVGPGGTGKTRLAIEVGSSVLGRSPDGVWFVDLSPLSARDQAVRAIASAVGLMETRPALGAAPAPPAEQPLEALTRSLADRELLLILDNCEHLVEACASIAHTLLTAGPRLRVLATSREPLNISGETVLRLPPLTVPAARANGGAAESEAVKLFAERASRVRPGFALTEENLPAVAQITRRLDGLPLAIELAAARVKVLTPQEIAGRLDDAFKLLGSGSRGGTQRHQTLRATIDWSYELLEERERVLFRRLAVFVGGFDHAAAEFVAAGDGLDAFEVLDALEVLVDRSLVLAEYAGAGSRFGMLQTMAQYAQEKLAEAGKTASVRGRHLSWCLDLAEKAEHGLEGSEQLEWLERLDRDRENIRAALEWAESDPALCESALRLGGALGRYWDLRDQLAEGRERLERLLLRAAGAPLDSRWSALFWAARLAQMAADVPAAQALGESATATAREWGDEKALSRSLTLLALIENLAGEPRRARELWEESIARARRIADDWSISRSLYGLGMLAQGEGDGERARSLLGESLETARRLGDQGAVALAHFALGKVAGIARDLPGAGDAFEACLAVCRKLGWDGSAAATLHELALVAATAGDLRLAAERHREALELRRRLGLKSAIAESLRGLAEVASRQQRPEQASSLMSLADAVLSGARLSAQDLTSLSAMLE